MAKHWYMKFDVDAWLSDERLNLCSAAAQGLWIKMLCVMHKNARRGYLAVNDAPLTPEQIARQTGYSAEEVSRLSQELLNAGVASATDTGVWFSRRMVNEQKLSARLSDAGKKGGNPRLKGRLKPRLKPTVAITITSDTLEEGSGEKPKARPIREDDCLRVYQLYPRKVAREAALRAIRQSLVRIFAKPNPPDDPVEWLCERVSAYAKTRAGEDQTYTPYPATWFNQGRYEDETADGGSGIEPDSAIIGNDLIPPWDTDHQDGGHFAGAEHRWFVYRDDWRAGRMTGPDWWRDTAMGRQWLADQARKARSA